MYISNSLYYFILGIIRRRQSLRISQIWKHSWMFSCTFYPGLPSLKNVHTHMIKWNTARYLHLYSYLFHAPCLINAAQRDKIKSHIARNIGCYWLEMISAHAKHHLQLITLCKKQVWLSEARWNNGRNVANYSLQLTNGYGISVLSFTHLSKTSPIPTYTTVHASL